MHTSPPPHSHTAAVAAPAHFGMCRAAAKGAYPPPTPYRRRVRRHRSNPLDSCGTNPGGLRDEGRGIHSCTHATGWRTPDACTTQTFSATDYTPVVPWSPLLFQVARNRFLAILPISNLSPAPLESLQGGSVPRSPMLPCGRVAVAFDGAGLLPRHSGPRSLGGGVFLSPSAALA